MSCRRGCGCCCKGATGPTGPAGGTGTDVDLGPGNPNLSLQFNNSVPGPTAFGGAPEFLYRGEGLGPTGSTPGELLVVGPTGHISWGSNADVFPTPDAHNTVGAFLRFGGSVGGAGLTNPWALASWYNLTSDFTYNLWTIFSDGGAPKETSTMVLGTAGDGLTFVFNTTVQGDSVRIISDNGTLSVAGTADFGAGHFGLLYNNRVGFGTAGNSVDATFGGATGGLLALYNCLSPPSGNPTASPGGQPSVWIWSQTMTNTNVSGLRFRFPTGATAFVGDVEGPVGLFYDNAPDILDGAYLVTTADLDSGGIMNFVSTPNMGADRTITFPAPAAGKGYTRAVWMSDTDLNGHNLTFTTGAGTTVATTGGSFNGTMLLLAITSAGVRAIG